MKKRAIFLLLMFFAAFIRAADRAENYTVVLARALGTSCDPQFDFYDEQSAIRDNPRAVEQAYELLGYKKNDLGAAYNAATNHVRKHIENVWLKIITLPNVTEFDLYQYQAILRRAFYLVRPQGPHY